MPKLTAYGGVNEIGGTKILLEEGERRIWLDFGMSFALADKYLDEYLSPKKYNGVLDFLKLGLLPELADMGGFYREDYLKHSGIDTLSKPAYDAVFLSHAHADHANYIHFIRKDIPIYSSEITRRILASTETTSPSSGFTDFTKLTESFQLRPRQKGEGWIKLKGEEARVSRDFRATDGYDNRVKLGDELIIEAVPVNHSLPGACAYIVHTGHGAIVYTGDLRFHGYRGDLTQAFVEKVAKLGPIALLCEGTRIGDEKKGSPSEEEIQEEIGQVVQNTDNLVIVDYPPKDIERMRTFHEVAKKHHRKLVITLKQAHLLKLLQDTDADVPALDDPHIAIYADRKRWGLITKSDWPSEIAQQDYDLWEREFLNYPNCVTCDDIRRNQREYIVRIDFFSMTDLVDIQPKPGSCYIRSITEPFDEEGEIQREKCENWLKLFGLYPYHQIHTSGHASESDIVNLIEKMAPKVLIPIHTVKPEFFTQHFKGSGIDVREPIYGQSIPIPD